MMKKDFLKTEHLKIIVLDEADEMLGRGFKDQIHEIFKLIPGDIQVALFSATMPPDCSSVTTDDPLPLDSDLAYGCFSLRWFPCSSRSGSTLAQSRHSTATEPLGSSRMLA